MAASINRCKNTAAGHDNNSIFSRWRKAAKKRSKKKSPRDYKADVELAVEVLILLSQSPAADDPAAGGGGDHPTQPKPSLDHHHNEITIYKPNVQNILTLDGDEICHQIVKPPASVHRNLAMSRKLHKCHVRRKCFGTGQELGGHKRKHFTGVIVRKVAGGERKSINSFSVTTTGIGGASSDDGGKVAPIPPQHRGLNFDLNLPPPPEED